MTDETDKAIVNRLQAGLPLTEQPYADAAAELGIGEDALLERIGRLLDAGALSRFGPLYDAQALGGELVLAAMAVPEADFEHVAEVVNGFPQVAHNYQRDHALNMWFVVATETAGEAERVAAEIEAETGLVVRLFPKEDEFFVGLRLDA
jgi:DNA-binding Lrp family transcriptional regulator